MYIIKGYDIKLLKPIAFTSVESSKEIYCLLV